MVEFRIHVAIEENAKSVAGTFLRKLVLKILELILSCKVFFFFATDLFLSWLVSILYF